MTAASSRINPLLALSLLLAAVGHANAQCVATSANVQTCTFARNSGAKTLNVPAGSSVSYTIIGGSGTTKSLRHIG